MSKDVEPTSYSQVSMIPTWVEAMNEKITALHECKRWDNVPQPPNNNVKETKWIFKIKCKSDGSDERYKAQLMARGFTQ